MTNYEPSLSSLHIELSNSYLTNTSMYSSTSSRKNDLIVLNTMTNCSSNKSSKDNSLISTPVISNLSKFFPMNAVNPPELNLNQIIDQSTSFYSNSSIESINPSEETSIDKIKFLSKRFPFISFTEDQPLHNRPNFQDKIEEIFTIYQEYENLTLNDITDNSYFSILWSPTKSTNNFVNNTSFLVFYRFRNKYLSNAVKFVPVIGLVTNKLDEEFWLTNTNLNYNPKYLNDFTFNKIFEDFSKNKYRYNQVVVRIN